MIAPFLASIGILRPAIADNMTASDVANIGRQARHLADRRGTLSDEEADRRHADLLEERERHWEPPDPVDEPFDRYRRPGDTGT